MEPPLFRHILRILHEMKAISSSSESSSDSSLALRALDELLDMCSMDDDAFLFFWLLRAKDFSLLGPSSH